MISFSESNHFKLLCVKHTSLFVWCQQRNCIQPPFKLLWPTTEQHQELNSPPPFLRTKAHPTCGERENIQFLASLDWYLLWTTFSGSKLTFGFGSYINWTWKAHVHSDRTWSEIYWPSWRTYRTKSKHTFIRTCRKAHLIRTNIET